MVLGPRRVGKTTVLYQTIRHLLAQGIDPQRIWWLRMDHPFLMPADLGSLVRAVLHVGGAAAERPVYLMLDEIVYAERWDLWLKTFYDEKWPVRIAATSSATAALRDRRAESGVGRWEEQYLTPYSFREFLALIDMSEEMALGSVLGETLRSLPEGMPPNPNLDSAIWAFMLVGGFPELLARLNHELLRAVGSGGVASQRDSPQGRTREDGSSNVEEGQVLENLLLTSQQTLRNDAVERAIYKDIPQSFNVNDPLMLERLLYVLAGRVAGLLSPSGICGDLGISPPTFSRYLSYLERAFLVFTLPNYSGTEAAVQRRGRKLYFVDGAVRNAALQRGIGPIDDPVERGLLLENLAAASLRHLAQHSGVRLYHWREGRHEVDLVLDHPNDPLAFEIASSASHRRTGLEALAERHGRFRGRCYLVAPQAAVAHPLGVATDADVAGHSARSEVGTLPLDMFLLAVGAQAQRALDQRLGTA